MSTDRVGGSGIVRRHKATHAAGGTDPLSPADIGAAILSMSPSEPSGPVNGQLWVDTDSDVTTLNPGDYITTSSVNASNGVAGLDSSAKIAVAQMPNISTSAQTDSYTLVLADAGKLVEMGKATAQTLTVPTNTSVAFPTGTKIDILQTGAGQVTVAGADGVTVNATPGLKISAQWGAATLIKRGTNTWVLVGSLTA